MGEMWWSAKELLDAIERCELECVTMIANHAPPEAIQSRRQGMERLYDWLYEAERQERQWEKCERLKQLIEQDKAYGMEVEPCRIL